MAAARAIPRLRHAPATPVLASRVHPKVASERLGPSTAGITPALYRPVLPGMREDAAARLDDAPQNALRKRRPQGVG
ncbi:integrase [Lichenibacterium ramalinae]|uniref:Integrase n=1 Tax=Lichenibacterium ramalinae TaxID=2316527 RepID=A0A4Q2RHM8_9HYPH|nr:integrase [Lichenibacterium ramalinae]